MLSSFVDRAHSLALSGNDLGTAAGIRKIDEERFVGLEGPFARDGNRQRAGTDSHAESQRVAGGRVVAAGGGRRIGRVVVYGNRLAWRARQGDGKHRVGRS